MNARSAAKKMTDKNTGRTSAFFCQLLFILLPPFFCLPALALDRPDVLMIVVDDMNDWITLLDPHAPIATPNLERLAARGVSFTRAYCASPSCNPSRTATLTGISPPSSGVYGNASDWRRALPDAITLPQHFRANGWRVEGAGKIFHHHLDGAFHDERSFDAFHPMLWPPDSPMPATKLNRLPAYGSANTDWGAWPPHESDALDVRTVDWCIERLRAAREQPLFLACGIFRPHMPFYVPQHWLDKFPADKVVMPDIAPDDLDDVPAGGRALMAEAARFFSGMKAAEAEIPGSWREAVRCYQAAAAFADAQIGRLLDALDTTPRGRETIVVLWSDHGYQLGEKDCWEKFTLWEKATRVPFLIVAPGIAPPGRVCKRSVSLLDLYPTLVEICGLPSPVEFEGASLVPLLRDPSAAWPRPAVMTYRPGNHAVRSERWRYIRYANGDEELYDHTLDPLERTNLAARAEHAGVIADLKRWLPDASAQSAPDLKAKRTETK
jgi:arylsulfatase A-like enzyme